MERDVVVTLKLSLTLRVPGETADEAEEVALDRVKKLVESLVREGGPLPGCNVVEEFDRYISQVRRVPAVRTVAQPRHIGDGVLADDWMDR